MARMLSTPVTFRAQRPVRSNVADYDDIMPKINRALSIRQPYAEWIMTGEKPIEYRSRRTHIRGRVYIYAAKNPGARILAQGKTSRRWAYSLATCQSAC